MEEVKLSRREFLKLAAIATAGKVLPPVESLLPEESRSETLPFEEILKKYKKINPKITAVNLSCIPDIFINGQKTGFHHLGESLVMAIPSDEVERELNLYGYASGLKEAVKRGQKVVLVVGIPSKPEKYDPQSWIKGVEKVAEYFQGASIFIIGNEINISDSPWEKSLDKYQKLYLAAYQKIKKISPRSSVFPWQEAPYGQGELLQEFLSREEVRGKIDGLAFNFYGLSKEIEGRVDLYRQILKQTGLSQLSVIISELGKPGFKPTHEQQARLVAQHLAMAAYLEKQGKIKLAAWYCAHQGPDSEHALSFSTDKEFVPKPALFAFVLAERLLAGDEIGLVRKPSGLVEVNVSNRGRPTACFAWNEGEEKIVVPRKPGCRQVWTPTGEKLSPYRSIDLYPSSKPSVYPGDTAIFTFRSRPRISRL